MTLGTEKDTHLKEEALDRTKCTNRFGRGLDLSSDGLLMMIPPFDRHQDTDNVRNSEATTRRKHNTQTPSDITGTIPQESKVLLILNILQITDTENEEILVYFVMSYLIL